MCKKNVFYILLLFLSITSFGQKADTTNIYSWQINHYFDTIPTEIDTSLFGFQHFHPAFLKSFSNTMVSNNGQATFSNIFDFNLSISGNPYFTKYFWPYLFNLEDLTFYNTKSPYTEGFYTIGQQKDQNLNFLHTQNISKALNVGFIYRLASVEGTFKRQKSRDNSLSLFSSYTSKRYAAHVAIGWNSLKSLVNGGILKDSLFEQTVVPTPTIEVNLNKAETDIYKKSALCSQEFNFFKPLNSTDSSLTKRNKYIFSVGHRLSYDKWVKTYSDLKTSFYGNWYYDGLKTKDSIQQNRLSNTVFFQLNEGVLKWLPLGVNIGTSYETAKYGCYRFDTINYDTIYNNTIVHAYFLNNLSKSLNFNFGAKFYYLGYNKNDFNAIAEIKKFVPRKSDSCWFQIQATMNRETPEIFLGRYFSNNFSWKIKRVSNINESIRLKFFWNKYNLDAQISYSILDNYIYFDTLAIPRQMSGSLNVSSVNMNHHFHIGKFYFFNSFLYQKSSDDNLRIPEILVNSSFFLRILPFQAKLPTHIGFDILYTSYYYGYAYMPASNIFYLQNERKFGGHPYVDFFISAQRKNVRLFFKAEHLSSLSFISKRNYYLAQFYPANGFGIRFGVSWRFSD